MSLYLVVYNKIKYICALSKAIELRVVGREEVGNTPINRD